MRRSDLAFLVGRWRGEGTLRGEAVTTRSECAAAADGSLRLDVETRRGGDVVHRESVEFRSGADGRVVVTTSPRSGTVQTWDVSGDAARLVLRHPGFVWEIRPGRDAWDETFDAVARDGLTSRIVSLRHVRLEGPAR